MKLKISRLFHWLYATLMFLPILMFIPSCLYYSLNKYATNETRTEVTYKYQSNEVNTLDDLVEGNLYFYSGVMSDLINDEPLISDLSLTFYQGYIEFETTSVSFANNIIDSQLSLRYVDLTLADTNASVICSYFKCEEFIFSFDNKSLFIQWFNNNGFEYLPQYTDYNVIESFDTNVQDTISNKMYLAWESVWNLPLFQWTKNSFITAPFSYITGLFGLSSDNSLNCVFTYFASISICWLVFDLIMYVPNLAHRWLDRSAIE